MRGIKYQKSNYEMEGNMNAFLSNAVASFLGHRPSYLVPADPAEFAEAFQTKATSKPDAFQESVEKRLANDRAPPKVARSEIVVMTLISAGGPLCVSDLAARMGCSVGEASRRITMAGKKVKKRKSRRHVFISLR